MCDEELLALFAQCATECTNRKFDDISLSSEISSLGIDSLTMLSIVLALEDKLSTKLPDEHLFGLSSVGDLLNTFKAQMSKKPVSPTDSEPSSGKEQGETKC